VQTLTANIPVIFEKADSVAGNDFIKAKDRFLASNSYEIIGFSVSRQVSFLGKLKQEQFHLWQP